MTSVPTLYAGNLTWPHGTENGADLDYMEGLSASSVLPPESFLDLQTTRGPAAVSHSFPEGGWVVGVGVKQEWVDVLLLVLKGLVMAAVIVASVLGNLLVIVSVARYVTTASQQSTTVTNSPSGIPITSHTHQPPSQSPISPFHLLCQKQCSLYGNITILLPLTFVS